MAVRSETRTRWLALFVLCGGTLMIVLDSTIVNVALPSIREDLGFSEASLAWVVNAYLLTFGGFLLLGGRLGDLYGHRRMFLYGLVLFTAASLGCGLAQSQEMLIAGRAVQGVGGAVVSAVGLSLMMTMFTEPEERAKAMGVAGFVASGGGSLGVLLGGVLTDTLDWHWIFLVNIPIGVAVFVLVPHPRAGRRGQEATGRLDVAGAVTVTAALMLAVYAIVNGNETGWLTAQTLGLLAVAAVLLGVFLLIESRVDSPLVPLSLFRRRNVVVGQRRRRAVGGRHVRVVLPVGALPAARARLLAAAGRPRVPAGEPDHGRLLGRHLGQARDEVRHPAAARRRPAVAGRARPAAVRARAGRRRLRGRRAAEHDPARASAPAWRSTRCCWPP